MGERSDRRRDNKERKAVQKSQRIRRLNSKYEAKWVARRSGLIEALEQVGHVPYIWTTWLESGEGSGPLTIMFCQRCPLKLRSRISRRWRGLSPRRPCEGDGSQPRLG